MSRGNEILQYIPQQTPHRSGPETCRHHKPIISRRFSMAFGIPQAKGPAWYQAYFWRRVTPHSDLSCSAWVMTGLSAATSVTQCGFVSILYYSPVRWWQPVEGREQAGAHMQPGNMQSQQFIYHTIKKILLSEAWHWDWVSGIIFPYSLSHFGTYFFKVLQYLDHLPLIISDHSFDMHWVQ